MDFGEAFDKMVTDDDALGSTTPYMEDVFEEVWGAAFEKMLDDEDKLGIDEPKVAKEFWRDGQ